MSQLIYSKTTRRLAWGSDSFNGISGGFGKGSLPSGHYIVKVNHAVINPIGSGFKDNLTGKSWFIPISHSTDTSRSGLGIHPDGSPPGTAGCIGLQGADANRFWTKWNNTALGQRPTSLEVT